MNTKKVRITKSVDGEILFEKVHDLMNFLKSREW